MPLEEGGRHTLLLYGVYLPGEFCGGGGDGGFCCINLVGADGGIIVTTEVVELRTCKVVTISDQQQHESWADSEVGHGEGWCC